MTATTDTTDNRIGFHLDPAAQVLAFAQQRRTDANQAEVDILIAANDWADLHPDPHGDLGGDLAESIHEYGDRLIPLAGPGVPLIAEFAVAEFAAALRLSTDAGRRLIADALELRHRLLRLWDALNEGEVPAWKARRIATATIDLSIEGAAYVDRHLAGIAHTVSLAQLDRLIDEARARFEPDHAADLAASAAESRCFDIVQEPTGFAGLAFVHGILDAADAHDLNTAITTGAHQLAQLGCEESLDVRRSMAAAALARGQLSLDLDREIVLHVHLSADALTEPDDPTQQQPGEPGQPGEPVGLGLARVEETRTVVTTDQIRSWCHTAGKVTVKPVIDLADHVHVAAYEIPDRIAERTDLRDVHCVFPYCTRPAKRCDHDHIREYARGGKTSTDNIAPLCRHHHRLKTHAAWSYTPIETGTYLWTSPHGLTFIRDHTGTRDITPPSRPPDRP
jgi:hypothetical protein